MRRFLFLAFFLPPLFSPLIFAQESPNNRVGIHIHDPTDLPLAQELVNSGGGDWGYVTVVIQDTDRDPLKWQRFFDECRRRHLIPLVRIATHPVNNHWVAPLPEDAEGWATFLHGLNWPTKDRHVILFNEPNHATEWGGRTDPAAYALVIKAFAAALKEANENFFILNAGLDAAAPQEPPAFMDSAHFLLAMHREVPGIFDLLDGWASHAYPNPGFKGGPGDTGKMSIRGYQWEQSFLAREFGVSNLPVFITETGWPHDAGVQPKPAFYGAEKVADFFTTAYTTAWNNPSVRAVTPFILRWKVPPFDHFSWVRDRQEEQAHDLGDTFPADSAYPQFWAVQKIPKEKGSPIQRESFEIVRQHIPLTMVRDQSYTATLVLENTGQSIWGERSPFIVQTPHDAAWFQESIATSSARTEPHEQLTLSFPIRAPREQGTYPFTLNLYSQQKFESGISLEIAVVDPPIASFVGTPGAYAVSIVEKEGRAIMHFVLSVEPSGKSQEIALAFLTPQEPYTFLVKKPYKLPSAITFLPRSGIQTVSIPRLRGGDFNDDGRISLGDLFALLAHPSRMQHIF